MTNFHWKPISALTINNCGEAHETNHDFGQSLSQKKELFRDETYAALSEICEIHGGIDAPMRRDEIDALLPKASFYVSALPELDAQEIEKASKLKATIEVAGAFREGLDYASCLNNGSKFYPVRLDFELVAEMTLAIMLAGGRGLIAEHEAFRSGDERWLDDRDETDLAFITKPSVLSVMVKSPMKPIG